MTDRELDESDRPLAARVLEDLERAPLGSGRAHVTDLYPLDPADEPCPQCKGEGEFRGTGLASGFTAPCAACGGDKTRGSPCSEPPGDCRIYGCGARLCDGTGRIPGNAQAEKVIEVGQPMGDGDWAWRQVGTKTWNGTPGADHSKEAALAAAREALSNAVG